MRILVLSLCLALALVLPAVSTAQGAPALRDGRAKIPQNILDGLDALRRDHVEDADSNWTRDSTLVRQGTAIRTLQNFKNSDGEYQGFELISEQDVTLRTRVIYLALEYERQPHFVKFVSYRTGKEWVLLSMDMNVNMETMQTELANRPQ